MNMAMNFTTISVVFFCCAISYSLTSGDLQTSVSGKRRYDNYKVYLLVPTTEKQLLALRSLQNEPEFDFWTEPAKVNRPAILMVPSNKNEFFKRFIEAEGISSKIQIKNVQDLIAKEEERLSHRSKTVFDWADYHNLDEVYAWLDKLEKNHANVKVIVGGKTYEGRDIKGIEINNGKKLPGVVIESGNHAREWISVAGTSWIINEILKDSADPIWRQFNFLYFPSINPDGYVFTFAEDRLWRKSRRPHKWRNSTCYGTDLNRNFDSHWLEIGASKDPCTTTYAGPEAFSDIETKSLADYLTKMAQRRNNKIFISYHSYGQKLLFPWSYTSEHIPEYEIYEQIGNASAASLEAVHGTKFKVGSINEIMYPASGTSTDWYYEKLNASLSYVYEMRDKGVSGFLLPPEQIIPVGEEHLESLRTILIEYQKLWPN